MTTKPCSDCGVTKSIDKFNGRTSRGHPYKMSVCKDCEKLRQQKYYKYRKLLEKLKEGKHER